MSGTGRPLIEDEKKRRQRLRNRTRRGAHVEPVGVDQGKALLYSRLKLTEAGPGYIHFANDPAFDDEYFAQLAAEKLVTKVRGTRPFQEWIQMRPRNEALDCMVYATAAMRLSRKPLDGPSVIRREEKPQPKPQPQAPQQPTEVVSQEQKPATISKGRISVSGLRKW